MMNRDEASIYEITLEGTLHPDWSSWFDGVILTQSGDARALSILTGALDQAALRGILIKAWDLNMTVVSVRRISECQLT